MALSFSFYALCFGSHILFLSFRIVKGRGNEGFVLFVLFMVRNNGSPNSPLFECVECRTAVKNENCDVFSHWLWFLEFLVRLYGSPHIKTTTLSNCAFVCLHRMKLCAYYYGSLRTSPILFVLCALKRN